jgi:hypothetical protein
MTSTPLANFPALAAFNASLNADPSVKAALQQELPVQS